MSDVILNLEDISIAYQTPRGAVKAVNNVSLTIHRGETVALIGESGSGKTTLSLALVRMLPASAHITSGKVLYTHNGKTRNVLEMSSAEVRQFRWSECAMVFQGAQNAFNPVLRIRQQFADTAAAHGHKDKAWIKERT